MTKTIQTQGVTVEVSDPYAEGHSCSAAEAKALNQVRAENVRNNTRKAVMEVLDANGGDVSASQAAVQKIVAEYDAGYEFTLASVGGGGTRLDPLTKECRSIAREYIGVKIKEQGMTQKEYLEKNGDSAIKDLIVKIAEDEQIVKLAKKNLAERAKMDSIDVSI
jgi:hypothetical protein